MIRIGNASGFYGDRFDAFAEMLDGGPLDVLTGDYLAELTMGILGRDLAKDSTTGYAKTFLRQMRTSLDVALDRGVTIVVNAGGLNPTGLAAALRELTDRTDLRIGLVTGDALQREGALSANAYLGAFGIAACLTSGANVVITGRVTDASLVVGPAIAHYGWAHDDLDPLAGATIAGHVLECGTQATGGNYSFFTEIADLCHPGFPIAEIAADGSATITKHPGTGGEVSIGTVTAQLLYELGAPAYLGPDVVAHFDRIALRSDGPDRVTISGAVGTPPPPTLKVGVTRLGGVRNSMTFVLAGLDIEAKAELVRRQLTTKLGAGLDFNLVRTDRVDASTTETASALLHVHASVGRQFSQAAVELALGSCPGATLTTAPGDATPYAIFTSESIDQDEVAHVAVRPDRSTVAIPPPAITEEPTVTRESPATDEPANGQRRDRGATVSRPLGEIIGARSGDKGGDANVGLWARSDEAYDWLRTTMTADKIRELLPEAAELDIDRYELPNLRAVNFVIKEILGDGVGGSTRFDPQAKALGEVIRGRFVDVPVGLR
ncbi:MAG TPA: acyclic terpene utilization AtuA family protein [Micromonosporaceae bacterium]